jgi:hypothetical protein
VSRSSAGAGFILAVPIERLGTHIDWAFVRGFAQIDTLVLGHEKLVSYCHGRGQQPHGRIVALSYTCHPQQRGYSSEIKENVSEDISPVPVSALKRINGTFLAQHATPQTLPGCLITDIL